MVRGKCDRGWLAACRVTVYANVAEPPILNAQPGTHDPLSAVWAGDAHGTITQGATMVRAKTEDRISVCRSRWHVGDVLGHSLGSWTRNGSWLSG